MEFNTPSPKEPKIQISEHMIQARMENLRLEQNIGLGIIGGLIGGFIGAALWAAITYFTEYQLGLLAIGVGFLVGYGVSKLGKGIDKVFGVAGGIIALVSIVLGNFLASIGFLAKILEVGYLDMLINFNYALTFELMKETFSVMDLLFYAIAIYEGYRFSFRKISREKLLEGAIMKTGM
ncbi:MAG: hypothetical protein WBB65_13505 [Anaerolineales bacterium]